MKPVFVLFHAGDLAVASKLGLGRGDARFVVFDPALVDKVTVAGLGPVHCVAPPAGPDYAERDAKAHAAASALESDLDAALGPEWAGRSLRGWQHLNLFYLAFGLQWFDALFAACADELGRLAAGAEVIVPVSDQAQLLYLPSFVTPVLLMQHLHRHGVAMRAYPYRANDALRPPAPDLGETAIAALEGLGDDWVLAHLPTCLYDAAYFDAELQAAGRPVVRLKARYWDVEIQSAATLSWIEPEAQGEQASDELRRRAEAPMAALRDRIETWLSGWLTAPSYRARQVDAIADTYRMQLLTDQLLDDRLGPRPPARLLLSDHDTGWHGPLLAFAQRHRVPVLLLPHSKTSTDLDFPAPGATLLHHPVQGEAVLDLDGRRPQQHLLDYPATLKFEPVPAQPLQTVGLVLNGISLSGIPVVDFRPTWPGSGASCSGAAHAGSRWRCDRGPASRCSTRWPSTASCAMKTWPAAAWAAWPSSRRGVTLH